MCTACLEKQIFIYWNHYIAILVEKGMLFPHWTSAIMASSSRSNSSGGVVVSINKHIHVCF